MYHGLNGHYKGLEFTYTTDKEFVTSTDMNQPEYMEIPDEMIKSCQIKGLGYPLEDWLCSRNSISGRSFVRRYHR